MVNLQTRPWAEVIQIRNQRIIEEASKGTRTLKDIGEQFQLTRERVRQIVGSPKPAPRNCVSCGKSFVPRKNAGTKHCRPYCSGRAAMIKNQENNKRKVVCSNPFCLAEVITNRPKRFRFCIPCSQMIRPNPNKFLAYLLENLEEKILQPQRLKTREKLIKIAESYIEWQKLRAKLLDFKDKRN